MESDPKKPFELQPVIKDPMFLDLMERLRQQYQPTSITESALVEQMAYAQWRMDRFARMEAKMLLVNETPTAKDFVKLRKYVAGARRSFQQALKLLMSLRKSRTPTTRGRRSRPGPEVFANLPPVDFAPTA